MNSTLMETCPATAASRYAEVLLGCFRRGEAEDGQIYVRAVVAVLTSYPEPIVKAVCDPRGGLPSKSQFLPTIYEIRVACDQRMRPLLAAEDQRRREAGREADAPPTYSEGVSERRREFIAGWRKRAEYALAAFGAGDQPPQFLDARKCQGEAKQLAVKANLAHVEKLRSEYTSTPCAPLRGYAGEGK